jgi:hypothetical protein
MKIPAMPFTVTDWAGVPATTHPGETGTAAWRTVMVGDVRVRMVEYSRGYRADHWCPRGHVLLVLAGEMVSELKDGRTVTLTAGTGYEAGDNPDNPHRSYSEHGCTLFIVD